MSDSEICRKISESLEPYSTLPKVSDVLALCIAEHPDYWEPSDEISGEWHPVDYFIDPAARDLLVRKILEQERTITIAWLPDRQVFSLHIGKGRSKHEFHIYDTYDRIWPLAYLKTILAVKEEA